MVYPDTFDGFMVNSHEKWSDFRKEEVYYHRIFQIFIQKNK